MTLSTPQPALAPRPTGRPAVVAWLLPFVAVGSVMLWHWAFTVPPGPLPPPVPKDPPPAKAPATTPDGDDDDDKDKDGFEPFTTPRADNLLVQLHEAYDKVAFKSEPTFEAWSAAHRPLLTQIVTATRMQAYKGITPAPSASTSNVECHTIRCRFTLSSSKEEDLQLLLDALAELKLKDVQLWHLWKADKIVEEPAKRAGAKPRFKTTVTVSFVRDLPKLENITLESGAPLRPATVTPVKSTPGPGAVPKSPAGTVPSVPSTSPPGPGPTTAPLRPSTAPTGTATPTGAPTSTAPTGSATPTGSAPVRPQEP